MYSLPVSVKPTLVLTFGKNFSVLFFVYSIDYTCVIMYGGAQIPLLFCFCVSWHSKAKLHLLCISFRLLNFSACLLIAVLFSASPQ